MMLITRPEHDPGTKCLSHWGKKIIDLAEARGMKVIDLLREKACSKEFVGRATKLKPDFIFLNGHGSDDCVTGHDNEPLVTLENVESLSGAVTYAVSCSSAALLGKAVAAKKDSTYIGYDDKFAIVQSADMIGKPQDDQRVVPFLEMSNQVAISLLKGHTCREAHERSQEVGKKHLRHLLASSSNPYAAVDAPYLWWNLKHQVCLGDQDKTIVTE